MRNTVVLFGFRSFTNTNDTWEWDGVWRRRVPGNQPDQRAGASMVWVPTRGASLLFGGLSRFNTVLNDSWEYR